MEISLIKKALIHSELPPKWAINEALKSSEAFAPELLRSIEEVLANPEKAINEVNEDQFDHIISLYILAKMRDKRVFPYLIQLAQSPEEIQDALFGFVITEGLSSLLISTYNGDMASLLALIENEDLDVFVRYAAIECFIGLYAAQIISRKEIIDYLSTLLKKSLNECDLNVENAKERYDDGHLFNALVVDTASILGCEELYKLIYTVFEKDIVDRSWIDEIDVRGRQALDQEVCLEKYLYENKDYLPIEDVTAAISWMYQSPGDIGRNDACPCMSGKKYKKCCIEDGTSTMTPHEPAIAEKTKLPLPDALRAIDLFDMLDCFAYGCDINKFDDNNHIMERIKARELWQKNPAMIDDFLAKEGDKLSNEDVQCIQKWKHSIKSRFVFVRCCDEYAIVYASEDERFYAIKALTDSFYNLFYDNGSTSPIFDTILFSYKDCIIWDGLLKLCDRKETDRGIVESLLFGARQAAVRNEIVMKL